MMIIPGKPYSGRLGPANYGGGEPEVKEVPVQQESTTVSEPWSKQQPYLEKLFSGAESEILNRPLQFFPGQTYVGYSPETETALGLQQQRAMSNPLLGLGQQQVANTLQGDYLANPYVDQLGQSVASQVIPAVQSGFARAGRTGTSPLAAEAMGRGIAQGMAPTVFGDYRRGRTEQERAAAMAPGLAAQDYYDIGQLRDVGAAREAMDARELQDAMARWEFAQREPATRLGTYGGLVQGNYGGTQTSTGTGTQILPYSPQNPLLTGLGVASSLAGIGGSLFSPFGMFGGP